jgi:hypothetical protein
MHKHKTKGPIDSSAASAINPAPNPCPQTEKTSIRFSPFVRNGRLSCPSEGVRTMGKAIKENDGGGEFNYDIF